MNKSNALIFCNHLFQRQSRSNAIVFGAWVFHSCLDGWRIASMRKNRDAGRSCSENGKGLSWAQLIGLKTQFPKKMFIYTFFFIVILYWILPLMQHRNRKECEIFFFNQKYLAKKLGQTMDHICAIDSNAITVHGIYQIMQTQLFLVSLWSLEHRRSNCTHLYFLSNRIFSSRSPSLYAEYRRSESIPMVHLSIFRMSWIKQLCHRSEWQLIT